MNQAQQDLSLNDEKIAPWDSTSSVEVVTYEKGVDVSVDLVAGIHADDAPLDPAEARRIRRKIDWQLLPLLFFLYTGKMIGRAHVDCISLTHNNLCLSPRH